MGVQRFTEPVQLRAFWPGQVEVLHGQAPELLDDQVVQLCAGLSARGSTDSSSMIGARNSLVTE